MKALIDANLSPRIIDSLREAGFDAVHVVDLGLLAATDDEIFDRVGDTVPLSSRAHCVPTSVGTCRSLAGTDGLSPKRSR